MVTCRVPVELGTCQSDLTRPKNYLLINHKFDLRADFDLGEDLERLGLLDVPGDDPGEDDFWGRRGSGFNITITPN